MKDKIIAKVYATTFVEIGKENNINVADEIMRLTEVINSSNDLENVLFLDVFTVEEKESVFAAISEKIKLSRLLSAAIIYLIKEKRISLLPLITKEVIVIDDEEKGFLKGTIEGTEENISEDYKAKLLNELKKHLGSIKPVLEYVKSSDIAAGYKVTVGDLQLDATIDNQLKSFKDSVLGK